MTPAEAALPGAAASLCGLPSGLQMWRLPGAQPVPGSGAQTGVPETAPAAAGNLLEKQSLRPETWSENACPWEPWVLASANVCLGAESKEHYCHGEQGERASWSGQPGACWDLLPLRATPALSLRHQLSELHSDPTSPVWAGPPTAAHGPQNKAEEPKKKLHVVRTLRGNLPAEMDSPGSSEDTHFMNDKSLVHLLTGAPHSSAPRKNPRLPPAPLHPPAPAADAICSALQGRASLPTNGPAHLEAHGLVPDCLRGSP